MTEEVKLKKDFEWLRAAGCSPVVFLWPDLNFNKQTSTMARHMQEISGGYKA